MNNLIHLFWYLAITFLPGALNSTKYTSVYSGNIIAFRRFNVEDLMLSKFQNFLWTILQAIIHFVPLFFSFLLLPDKLLACLQHPISPHFTLYKLFACLSTSLVNLDRIFLILPRPHKKNLIFYDYHYG